MGGATEEYWVWVLAETIRLLERGGCPHLVIGSLATGSYLVHDWSPAHDMDFFIPRSRAASLLDGLPEFSGVGRGREPGGVGEHVPILYLRDRLELEVHRDFWLSPKPDRL
jgi:hypothetical protein